jgi:hypothetical protein
MGTGEHSNRNPHSIKDMEFLDCTCTYKPLLASQEGLSLLRSVSLTL